MTHALCSLCNGDMGCGLIRFWAAAGDYRIAKEAPKIFAKGAIVASVCWTALTGISHYFLHQRHKQELARIEQEAYEHGADFSERLFEYRCKTCKESSSTDRESDLSQKGSEDASQTYNHNIISCEAFYAISPRCSSLTAR